ncbi:MAG TPA: DUF5313 family protein [Sporichthyaceae bacterium]|nr:DUF5313 family protein [Sporichthyaceae bacterium]
MASGRPGPLRWLFYAYGGRLGPRYAQWVLHDLTCRAWFVRHLLRTVAQWAPSLLLLLLPFPVSFTVLLPLMMLFCALYMAVSFAWEMRSARLYRHGFVPELVLSEPEDDPPGPAGPPGGSDGP